MSTTPKRYRLRKDVQHPNFTIPKGEVIEKKGYGDDSAYVWKWFVLHPDNVESNYEWFELITETPTEEFVWTDELVRKVVGEAHRDGFHDKPCRLYDRVENFKQSNQSHIPKDFSLETREVKTNLSTPPPKERIEVKLSTVYSHNDGYVWSAHLYSTNFIQSDKFPAIKAAIEKAINQ